MLKHFARFRVHVILGAVTVLWFSLGTIAGVIEGNSLGQAFWISIREVKVMEWISGICMWAAMASLVKQNDELRAKVELLTSRQ